jgi:hypothetical protein
MVFAEVVARIPYHGAVLSDDTPVALVASALIWSILWTFTDPTVMPTVTFTFRVWLREHSYFSISTGG